MNRGPYKGMWNVVRFNWTKYAAGIATVVITAILGMHCTGFPSMVLSSISGLALLALLLPLIASHVIYDRSALYQLRWLDAINPNWTGTVLNINAGFDETSATIKKEFPLCTLHALDFYDSTKHTEPSIERARKVHANYPGTRNIATDHLPFPDGSVDLVLAFLSLHEIRDPKERITALREIRRVLGPTGRLIVTEHLRDAANFIAFNFGFFHFHSSATWRRAFDRAGFRIQCIQPTTPFITTFTLHVR